MSTTKRPTKKTKSKKLTPKKKLNWKFALPIVLVVALVGGFVVYKSFASGVTTLFIKKGSFNYAGTTASVCRSTDSRKLKVRVIRHPNGVFGINAVRSNVAFSNGQTRPATGWVNNMQTYVVNVTSDSFAVNVRFSNDVVQGYGLIRVYNTPGYIRARVSALPTC